MFDAGHSQLLQKNLIFFSNLFFISEGFDPWCSYKRLYFIKFIFLGLPWCSTWCWTPRREKSSIFLTVTHTRTYQVHIFSQSHIQGHTRTYNGKKRLIKYKPSSMSWTIDSWPICWIFFIYDINNISFVRVDRMFGEQSFSMHFP